MKMDKAFISQKMLPYLGAFTCFIFVACTDYLQESGDDLEGKQTQQTVPNCTPAPSSGDIRQLDIVIRDFTRADHRQHPLFGHQQCRCKPVCILFFG